MIILKRSSFSCRIYSSISIELVINSVNLIFASCTVKFCCNRTAVFELWSEYFKIISEKIFHIWSWREWARLWPNRTHTNTHTEKTQYTHPQPHSLSFIDSVRFLFLTSPPSKKYCTPSLPSLFSYFTFTLFFLSSPEAKWVRAQGGV